MPYITETFEKGAQIEAFKDYHTGIENVNHQMGYFVSKHLKDLGEQGQKVLSLTGDAAVRLGRDMSGLPSGRSPASAKTSWTSRPPASSPFRLKSKK